MANKKFDHKFYYIYKTVNLITGKIYVGQRSVDNNPINDGYLGSGKYFLDSVKKHGKENFKKEILEFCTKDQLDFKERRWIELLNSRNLELGYNLAKGGEGGGSLGELNPMFGKTGEQNPFYGKHHSEETIAIMVNKAENREIVECPHCRVEMNISNAVQYHFDNCLMNPNITQEILEKRRNEINNAIEASKETVTCPYCGKVGARANMIRYHFDNCEFAPVLSENAIKRLWSKEQVRIRYEEELQRKRDLKEPELYICTYCGLKSYDSGNFYKYHGPNCKLNPDRVPKIFKCIYCGLETENKSNISRFHNDKCPHKPKEEL